jgi:hypothetical protein
VNFRKIKFMMQPMHFQAADMQRHKTRRIAQRAPAHMRLRSQIGAAPANLKLCMTPQPRSNIRAGKHV